MDGHLHLPSNSRLILGEPSTGRPTNRATVFLDRDGVLLEERQVFVTEPGQLRILPGVPEALQLLQDEFYLIVVTNQSGIARGLLTENVLLEIHAALVNRLADCGAVIDGLYYCPHHPEASVPEYKKNCECRKPNPGMFLRAAEDWNTDLDRSFMVGDMARDIEAAQAAGVHCIQIRSSYAPSSAGVQTAGDLLHAAGIILSRRLARSHSSNQGSSESVQNKCPSKDAV